MKKINRKNVLIIGSCAKEYALAKKLSELDWININGIKFKREK